MISTTLKMALTVIESSPMVYLTTINEQNYPETRAMLNLRNKLQYPQLQDGFCLDQKRMTIPFTTNTSSGKMKQILSNPKASAYYCIPEQFQGVWVSGDLEIVDDNEKQNYWVSNWNMYYPGGYSDPDYTIFLLKPNLIKGYENFSTYTELFKRQP